ncbi:mannitol dehydrogenase family protein [Tessaracoccus rhinocerotis]|uniref:mannitol dehydrogenase family protein n=1 Tax=Tessaracoccus rhinocerotis TaxID=1689449 RepID=UPI001C8F39FB|nr:mannitol dehydrogenase family protein [Tessaracoccus rhinocerotis]
MTEPLNATTYEAGTRPPVRIVHLGLGAFHRAHQAWYTQRAGDGWGIAAFTGRSPDAAEVLAAQDGLYTLVVRGPDGDSHEVITSVVAAHDGADLAALAALVAQAEVAVVTLTVTEAGYKLRPGNAELDVDDPQVAADIEALRAHYAKDFTVGHALGGKVRSATARLVVGLAARRAADGWPIAVVSCDNLPGNGAAAKASVLGFASAVDPLLAKWIVDNVSFVDSSIDRITPRTTDEDKLAVAEATGYADASPVVTEPFASWVLAGDFPGGRPAWESAGAVFVDDLEAFERRKLWLLNGAHSLMAYAGALRGHGTISAALADPVVSGWVEDFWDAAANHLTDPELDVPGYRAALRDRFANPRIAHYLSQIGMDGTLKLAARAVPVFLAERRAGRDGVAALRPIAAWMDRVTEQVSAGEHVQDPAGPRIAIAAGTDDQTPALLALVDQQLASELDVVAALKALRGTFKN